MTAITGAARKPYLPFHMSPRIIVPTIQPPQQQGAAVPPIAAVGRVTAPAAGGGASNRGSTHVGGILVPAAAPDEDDDSRLCSVCMEAPLTIMLAPCGHYNLCHKCFASIWAADKLVRYARITSSPHG